MVAVVPTSRDLRDRLGFSKAQWARALNVSPMTIQRWEDGSSEPSGLAGEVLYGIAAALNSGADPAVVTRRVRLGIAHLISEILLATSDSSR